MFMDTNARDTKAEALEAELSYISFKTARQLKLPTAAIAAYYGSRAVGFEARYQEELAASKTPFEREIDAVFGPKP